LEPAAGLAGLVKVLLSMEKGVVPPSLHVVRPNDHIRFEDTPFFLADRVVEWPRNGGPRRGAVSAFGMGGVNAHVVLEEAPLLPAREATGQDAFVVRVTATDEDTVRSLAAAYADRFGAARDGAETADLCHTANTGRSPLEFQTAVHGRSAAELADALCAVAAGTVPVVRADADLTAEEAARRAGTAASAPHRPADAAALVRAGYAHVDWAALSAVGARVTDLPTYPFAAGSFWRTPAPAPGQTPAPDGAEAVRVTWRARELASVSVTGPATVSVIAADTALGDALTLLLRDRGATVVAPGPHTETAVVIEAPGGRDGTESDLGAFWTRTGDLLKALPAHAALLWAAGNGAAVHPGERADIDPARAATAMAVRAAGAEGRRPTAVVHLDPAEPAATRAAHLAVEYAHLVSGTNPGADSGTSAAAWRAGVRYAPDTVPAGTGPAYVLPADGYVLVTGGLGAVGLRLVERLVDRGARHVGIVGRSAVDPARAAALRELERRAEVAYLACDVSDPAALAGAAERFGRRWGRLVGVVHASGGVNPFGAMHRRPWEDAGKVLAPKVAGSLHAVRLAKEQGADFAVLVSSIAGTQALAGRGLVDYSLANAFQLALAERENGTGTTVTAHAWPDWTGVGMKADASFSAAHAIGAEQALDAFSAHLRSGGAVIFPGAVPETAPVAAAVPETVPEAAPAVGRVPSGVLRAQVRDAFLHVLGEDPGDRSLQALGLDSLVIAELTTALERGSGLTVDPSLLMRARTADDIAAGLASQAPPAPAERPAVPDGAPGGAPVADLSALLRPLLKEAGA
ncbi:SDR family NAD(P)-dependent oxidoreductase, partial [Streptomyces termitum]|uniref:SDR family NAD(P)-dependent oxidoreductase n=1 Tax=Streptomyces termitum TaxID=67368 RepID=UPI0033B19B47